MYPNVYSAGRLAVFACIIMKTLFTSAATAYRTLRFIPLKSNLSQDYGVCLFLKIFLVLIADFRDQDQTVCPTKREHK